MHAINTNANAMFAVRLRLRTQVDEALQNSEKRDFFGDWTRHTNGSVECSVKAFFKCNSIHLQSQLYHC